MADNLIDLPTDKQPIGQEELLIVDKLFNNHQSTFHSPQYSLESLVG